jgi:hypothetical protein
MKLFFVQSNLCPPTTQIGAASCSISEGATPNSAKYVESSAWYSAQPLRLFPIIEGGSEFTKKGQDLVVPLDPEQQGSFL